MAGRKSLLSFGFSSRYDFSETEDEEEAAAEDDELSQAAVHGQSATIDLDEDDGLGEALGIF